LYRPYGPWENGCIALHYTHCGSVKALGLIGALELQLYSTGPELSSVCRHIKGVEV